ncbi:hypothetical protein F5877DRAFT_86623 [Lentinula edodes]|nr:hypothetical protein F5877DRAFT_86623 [Lentinula edodes]
MPCNRARATRYLRAEVSCPDRNQTNPSISPHVLTFLTLFAPPQDIPEAVPPPPENVRTTIPTRVQNPPTPAPLSTNLDDLPLSRLSASCSLDSDVPLFTSHTYLSSSATSPSPSLLPRKLWDLNLSNVEATPHVKPRIASPLPPPTLEDVHPQAQSPGTYLPGRIPSRELTTSRPISIYDLFKPYIDVLVSTTPTTRYYKVPYFYLTSLCLRDLLGPPRNPLKGHHLFAPATTRSFLSLVAVPVAPFKLQPAPSTLQHKPSYTKPYLKTYSDPGLTGRSNGTVVKLLTTPPLRR